MCTEHLLDPDNASSEDDANQDDLDLLNGSLDPSIEDTTDVKEKTQTHNEKKPNENGGSPEKGLMANIYTFENR